MPKFLTDEWVEQAKAVRAEFQGTSPSMATTVRANMIITAVPFGSGTFDAYLDTSEGTLGLGVGHIPKPEFTVTLDYETAKAMIVEQDPQMGMQAFMAGRLKIRGDMGRLMALQQGGLPSMPSGDLQARLRAITD
jgi:hypothetical protein